MKYRSLAITLFASAQLVIFFLYVYQYSTFVSTQRHEQQKERELAQLYTRKNRLDYELSQACDPHAIKSYAQHELGMIPLRLERVHTIAHLDTQ